MADDTPSKTPPAVTSVRQRKSHRKSRLGCGNCKLRGVKCDEAKPSCKRCAASGFRCNYVRSVPDLQLAAAPDGIVMFEVRLGPDAAGPAVSGPTHQQQKQRHQKQRQELDHDGPLLLLSPDRGLDPGVHVPVMTPLGGAPGSYRLRPDDCEALVRFSERTIWTIGNSRLKPMYRHQSIILSGSNPFLIHAFLAFTFIHDAHLSSYSSALSSSPSRRASLAFHWYHATALFARLLARPPDSLQGQELDALWGASTLLGATAFAHLDSRDPLRSWPLKDECDADDDDERQGSGKEKHSDLNWLRLSEGKKAVWALVNPARPDSVFRSIYEDAFSYPLPDPAAPIPRGVLPPPFYSLFDIEEPDSSSSSSTKGSAATNPYRGHVSLLAQLLPLAPNGDNFLSFLLFCSQPDTRYRQLLERHDHRAMLLLAWWYAKVALDDDDGDKENHGGISTWWWVRARALVEGVALCVYLERRCADERVLGLLEFPRAAFRASGHDVDDVRRRLDSERVGRGGCGTKCNCEQDGGSLLSMEA